MVMVKLDQIKAPPDTSFLGNQVSFATSCLIPGTSPPAAPVPPGGVMSSPHPCPARALHSPGVCCLSLPPCILDPKRFSQADAVLEPSPVHKSNVGERNVLRGTEDLHVSDAGEFHASQ